MLGSVCCVSSPFSFFWFCPVLPVSVSSPSSSRLLPTSRNPNCPSFCVSPGSNCTPSSVFKATSPSLRCLTFVSVVAPCVLFFVLGCYCFSYWPASLFLSDLGLFACFDCLLLRCSLPCIQSVKLVLTHHFSLCYIWNILYTLLYNMINSRKLLSSSLFWSSQLCSFHSFPPPLYPSM